MEPSRSPYAGMTVEERRFTAGLLAAFDAAARGRDRTGVGVVALLERVDLYPDEAAETADAILREPRRYGY